MLCKQFGVTGTKFSDYLMIVLRLQGPPKGLISLVYSHLLAASINKIYIVKKKNGFDGHVDKACWKSQNVLQKLAVHVSYTYAEAQKLCQTMTSSQIKGKKDLSEVIGRVIQQRI